MDWSTLYLIGTMLTVTALTAAGVAAGGYVLLTRGRYAARAFARGGVYVALGALLIAAVLLVYLFVDGRYGYDYVYNYSSSDLELRYKIASIWAGQQGSFLVWALVGLLAAPWLIRRTREMEPYVLAPFMLVQCALLLFMLVLNPFKPLVVDQQVIIPPDGKGLNELLHNPWMVIHPPILFTGYGLLAVPFAYAVGGLWRGDYDGWARRALPWTIGGWAVLGTALTLGGYWAYETLGWGGYWGWDPVENSSLVPWLLATALLHGLVLQRTHGGLRRTNMILAMATFAFIFYASYLTRSGVLDNFSVHSFAAAGLGPLMASSGFALVGGAIGLLAWRWRAVPRSALAERFVSRDSFFVLGMLSFVLLALVVIFGTSMPLLSAIPGFKDGLRSAFQTWFDPNFAAEDGRFSLRTTFYSQTTPPLGLVILVLMAIAPLLGWRGADGGKLLRSLRLPALGAVLATALALVLMRGERTIMALLYVALAAFALGANLLMVVRTVRGGWLRLGGYLSHVGVALLLIGFVASSAYATPELRLLIPEQQTQQAYGYNIRFDGYELIKTSQGQVKGGLSMSAERDGSTWQGTPQYYYNDRMGSEMRTPAIWTSLFQDLYISPVQYIGENNPNETIVEMGQASTVGPYSIKFVSFELDEAAHGTGSEDRATVGALLEITHEGQTSQVVPKITLVAEQDPQWTDAGMPGGTSVQLTNFDPQTRQIMLTVKGLNLPIDPAKADVFVSVKPGIGLVWLGMLVIVLGGAMAVVRRVREGRQRRSAAVPAPTGAAPAGGQGVSPA